MIHSLKLINLTEHLSLLKTFNYDQLNLKKSDLCVICLQESL